MLKIPEQVVVVGNTIASELMDATIAKSLAGTGCNLCFSITNYTPKFQDLIIAYLNGEIDSVTAIYIAMKREEEQL